MPALVLQSRHRRTFLWWIFLLGLNYYRLDNSIGVRSFPGPSLQHTTRPQTRRHETAARDPPPDKSNVSNISGSVSVNGARDAILKQNLELLRPTRRELQVRPTNGTTVTGTTSIHPNRKPRGYWKDVSNIDRELRNQWLRAIGGGDADSISNISSGCSERKRLASLLHPPPLPNETLLAHWQRHDLRYAIRNFGGRTLLAEALTAHHQTTVTESEPAKTKTSETRECCILPGKWKEMTGHHTDPPQEHPTHPLIAMVLEKDPSLDPRRAPVSIGQKKRLRSERYGMSEKDIESWIHGGRDGDGKPMRWRHVNNYLEPSGSATTTTNNNNGSGEPKPRKRKRAALGTWSRETIREALSEYLARRKRTKGIPSVWMPRPSEFEHGSDDGRFGYLKNAIAKAYGPTRGKRIPGNENENDNDNHNNNRGGLSGVDKLCCEMGMIPYHEWRYIEGLHDLMVTLKEQIDREHREKSERQQNSTVCDTDDDGDDDNDTDCDVDSSSSGPDYSVFPEGYSTTWRNSGPQLRRLFYLVKDYGGSHLVAGRLGMAPQKKMSWGPFDLRFGISLMEYIRLEQLRKEPRNNNRNRNLNSRDGNGKHKHKNDSDHNDSDNDDTNNNHNEWTSANRIRIPTRNQLLSKSQHSPASLLVHGSGIHRSRNNSNNGGDEPDFRGGDDDDDDETWGEYLDRKIIDYGGYESVARRLGLDW